MSVAILAQVVAQVFAGNEAMAGVTFLVYQVTFVTQACTRRGYVGYTKCLDLRRYWHRRKPPSWMKAAHKTLEAARFTYRVLEKNIPTKCAALAAEAIWAARQISKFPHSVRGGPWVRIELTQDMRQEIEVVSLRKSLIQLWKYADAHPRGLLYKHLKDLSFERSASGYRGAVVTRASRSGPSGEPGNASRRSQLDRDVLKKPSAQLTRLHRGIDAQACRARETLKRKTPR